MKYKEKGCIRHSIKGNEPENMEISDLKIRDITIKRGETAILRM